jgi:hypothetical protein
MLSGGLQDPALPVEFQCQPDLCVAEQGEDRIHRFTFGF